MKYSPCQQYLLTGGDDNKIKIWCAHSAQLLFVLKEHKEEISDMMFN